MTSHEDSVSIRPRLVLASGSPRRRDLLRSVGFDPKIVPPEVEELKAGSLPPRELCLHNARLKSVEVSKNFRHDYVVASDTVVAMDRTVFGKPESICEAAANLRRLSGRVHEVMSAVVIQRGEQVIEFVEVSCVKFRKLGEAVIQEYLSRVPVLDKAGGYAIQDHGDWLVEEIEGDYENIVGLPLAKVLVSLEKMGFGPPERR